MADLTAQTRDFISRSVLCWLATADASGNPNVSPKEIFCAGDDGRLLIADIASPVSTKNIAARPQVCVSFVDVFAQKGVKLTGTAELINSDDAAFADVARPLVEMAGQDFAIRTVIAMTADRVRPIVAPSFAARPHLSMDERKAAAYQVYGVMPVQSRQQD